MKNLKQLISLVHSKNQKLKAKNEKDPQKIKLRLKDSNTLWTIWW